MYPSMYPSMGLRHPWLGPAASAPPASFPHPAFAPSQHHYPAPHGPFPSVSRFPPQPSSYNHSFPSQRYKMAPPLAQTAPQPPPPRAFQMAPPSAPQPLPHPLELAGFFADKPPPMAIWRKPKVAEPVTESTQQSGKLCETILLDATRADASEAPAMETQTLMEPESTAPARQTVEPPKVTPPPSSQAHTPKHSVEKASEAEASPQSLPKNTCMMCEAVGVRTEVKGEARVRAHAEAHGRAGLSDAQRQCFPDVAEAEVAPKPPSRSSPEKLLSRAHTGDSPIKDKECCNTSSPNGDRKSQSKNERQIKTGPHQCRFCSKVFQNATQFVIHARFHTGERPFKCLAPECGKAFAQVGDLNKHFVRAHTGDQSSAKSPRRGKSAKGLGQLKSQTRTKSGEARPQKCPTCSKVFKRPDNLKVHIRFHTGEKPFNCDVAMCGKGFAQASDLAKHLRTHAAGQSSAKSAQLDKLGAKRPGQLKSRTAEPRPHQCPTCTKTFSFAGNLRRHSLIHSGEKPFQCPHCDKAFNQATHLMAHVRIRHA